MDGKALSSCTPHTGAWVTDIVFAKNSKRLVTVGNNVQVSTSYYIVVNTML